MWTWFKRLIDEKIIRHFRESRHEVHELGWSTAIGLFWALTPLVGVQMILVALTWGVLRPFGFRFQPAIAMAWVWLTNPVTMPPFYYFFYMVGYYVFRLFGLETAPISFSSFDHVLQIAMQKDMVDGLLYWLQYMVAELGWPMLVGGFAVGIPSAILGYPATVYLVNRFRARSARKLGLTLKQWEDRFVYNRHPTPLEDPTVPSPDASSRPLTLAGRRRKAAKKGPGRKKTTRLSLRSSARSGAGKSGGRRGRTRGAA